MRFVIKNSYFLFVILFFYVLMLFLFLTDTNILKNILNIPVMNPIFADIRTITGYNISLDTFNNPLINNIGDPWKRPMNYPPFWASFAEFMNLYPKDTLIFGTINVTLYIMGLIIFLNKFDINLKSSIIFSLCIFSPASILLMERGNIDMIIFFLISLSIVFYRFQYIYLSVILLASFLKIFPIIAYATLINLFKINKKIIFYVLILILIFSIYIFYNYDYFILLNQGTPRPINFAYGKDIIWMTYNSYAKILKIITYLYLIILLLFLIKYKTQKVINYVKLDLIYIKSFQIGSLIFLFTFILNNNWDYRLVFLIFTLPYLIAIYKSNKLLSFVTIFSIIFTLWYLLLNKYFGVTIIIIDEIINWITFTLLALIYKNTVENEFSSN